MMSGSDGEGVMTSGSWRGSHDTYSGEFFSAQQFFSWA